MAKGYLETTVLTNWLLKPGDRREAAAELLAQFSPVEIPVFAIKELKAGPLKNVVWMYNTLHRKRSFAAALGSLQRMSLTPKRYTTATALEALQSAAQVVGPATDSEIGKGYGSKVAIDEILADRYRLTLRHLIERSWRKRYAAGTRIQPLSCYPETPPTLTADGLLSLEPTKCSPTSDCCLAAEMKRKPDAVGAMRDRITSLSMKRREDERRSGVLRTILRDPGRAIGDSECRYLGDAVFAFFAPAESTILTTNLRDLEPLAQSLGKKCSAPAKT